VSTTSPPAGGNHPLIDDLLEEVALRERVRAHYAGLAGLAAAAATCGCGQPAAGDCGAAELYPAADRDALPETAVLASLSCGNPTAVAALREGGVGRLHPPGRRWAALGHHQGHQAHRRRAGGGRHQPGQPDRPAPCLPTGLLLSDLVTAWSGPAPERRRGR
jgi:hypothetical protein